MLVLERRVDEQIVIGDHIVLTVVEIRGRYSVRLGVAAPPEVGIWRQELAGEEPRRRRGPTASSR